MHVQYVRTDECPYVRICMYAYVLTYIGTIPQEGRNSLLRFVLLTIFKLCSQRMSQISRVTVTDLPPVQGQRQGSISFDGIIFEASCTVVERKYYYTYNPLHI